MADDTGTWMHLAAAVDAGWVIGGIIVWVLSQVLAGVVAARVVGAKHGEQITTLFQNQAKANEAIRDMASAQAEQARQITQIERARLECRAQAVRDFVDKGEHVRVIAQQTAFERQVVAELTAIRESVDKKLDAVHGRVTDVAKQIARMEGAA
ncbi:MAG: hypothetical protein BWX88_02679 [Planctomycetes bacterium ADurb.Bin126]|nr:MAG: hypothetical protein BWX88_02679 [Planctomycetes bacterium ADurb.Bin126]HOD79969.1 hypothetical protein [Phycisphaerae bacterium]HQL74026.1 hypothetical protein [Phycisphaerae bacterium]